MRPQRSDVQRFHVAEKRTPRRWLSTKWSRKFQTIVRGLNIARCSRSLGREIHQHLLQNMPQPWPSSPLTNKHIPPCYWRRRLAGGWWPSRPLPASSCTPQSQGVTARIRHSRSGSGRVRGRCPKGAQCRNEAALHRNAQNEIVNIGDTSFAILAQLGCRGAPAQGRRTLVDDSDREPRHENGTTQDFRSPLTVDHSLKSSKPPRCSKRPRRQTGIA